MSLNTKEILEYLSKDKSNNIVFCSTVTAPLVMELYTDNMEAHNCRTLKVLQSNSASLNPLFDELTSYGAELFSRSPLGLCFIESRYDISDDKTLESFVESLNPKEWNVEFSTFCERDEEEEPFSWGSPPLSKELLEKELNLAHFDMKQLQNLGFSHAEQVEFLKTHDLTGKVVFYADDVCSYEVYVEEAKGLKIKGIEMWADSHYSGATYPEPDIPILRHTEVDLSDEDIYFEDISVREFKESDQKYIEDARARQAEFKKTMVKVPDGLIENCYQEFIIDAGSFSDAFDITLINIVGLEDEVPYVVNRGFYIEDINQFKGDVLDVYSSCRGVVLPDTTIRYKFKDEEFSISYAKIKEDPDSFLNKIKEQHRSFVSDFMSVLSEMEYGKEAEREER